MSLRITFILVLMVDLLFSQAPNIGKLTEDDADEHFKHKNYLMAIPIYRKELKKFPDNDVMRLKLAQCLLNTRVNREEAVTLLEKLSKSRPDDHDVWFELGRAYHLTYRLEKAEKAYKKVVEIKAKREEEIRPYLQQVSNAKSLMANPVNVTFQNLGADINSDEPDYYPFVTANETFMVFTSRRKDNVGGKKVEMDGYRNSDVYYSRLDKGKWSKATNAGKIINTSLDEQVVGLKKDASELVIYIDHIDKFGDLYLTAKKSPDADYMKYKPVDPIINEKIETSGTFSEDGNVFFFSRRDKIDGDNDLYICKKLPNGKWGLPFKLPETINTKKNEDFPYFAEDCSTLYFSSEGHNSMGGYDLFKTYWNQEDNSFSKPENLGYPINSTDDDRGICVTPDNRVGYVSAFRPGGFGDLDVYRVKFNDNEQISRIFVGKVFLGDTLAEHQPKDIVVSIIATNKNTNDEYTFVPHTKNGKYVISLPAGTYSILITSNGFKDYKEEMIISDIGSIEMEKNRNYTLLKKE